MNATVTYLISEQPHPFDDKKRAQGVKAWCLVEVVTPEAGPKTHTNVAMFNYASEAERFQAHVFASGLDGKLVSIDRDVKELLTLWQKPSAR